MKIFLASHVLELTSKVIPALNNIGVEYTHDVNDLVQNTLHLRETYNDVSDLISADDTLLTQFGGNVTSYVRSKNNLSLNDISEKYKLHQKLSELGLPNIATIFPTSAEQIQQFFDNNAEVYCKPSLGEARGTLLRILNTSISPELNVLLPSTYKHFYKKYTSYEQFCTDIDINNFIDVQNSNRSLVHHKCILQKVYSGDTIFPVWVGGYVNGNQEYYTYPIATNEQGSIGSFNDDGKNVYYNNGINAQDGLPSDEHMLNAIRDPAQHNVDKYGILEQIRTLFTDCNIKNTPFSAQAVVINGITYIHDVSIKLQRTNFVMASSEEFEDHLKFAFDLVPNVTKQINKFSMFILIKLSNGSIVNNELVASAKQLNLLPAYAQSNSSNIALIAVGDSKQEIIDNIKAFYTSIS
jgi:hypothetical protein